MKFELKQVSEAWAVLCDGQVLAAFGSEKTAEKWMTIEQKKERLKAASNQFRDALDDLGSEGIEVDVFVRAYRAQHLDRKDPIVRYEVSLTRTEGL